MKVRGNPMSELDLFDTPPLTMAEALYIGAGHDALEVLQSKIDTAGDALSGAERRYVCEVRDWLKSLLDEEARLRSEGLFSTH